MSTKSHERRDVRNTNLRIRTSALHPASSRCSSSTRVSNSLISVSYDRQVKPIRYACGAGNCAVPWNSETRSLLAIAVILPVRLKPGSLGWMLLKNQASKFV